MPDRLANTGSAGPILMLPITRHANGTGRLALNRARRLSFPLVAVLFAATFTFATPANAQAAAPPSFSITPDSGAVAGGTEVTVTPPPGVTFTSVSAGDYHSLAVGSDGKTYAWGNNSSGQLGDDGAGTNQSTPVAVVLPSGVTFTSVSAGAAHSLAVGSDGTTYAWGSDVDGQLGDGGDNEDQSAPVAVVLPAGVTFERVSAGGLHSLAVGSDGKAYAWGWDLYGQLGDGGAGTDHATPVAVLSPGVTFTSVSAGYQHSLAIGSDGKAYAWGSDGNGRVGDGGSNTNQSTPVAVVLPAGVTATSMSAGLAHSLAVGSDGKTYAWGFGSSGQLGDGGAGASRSTPVAVALPAGVTLTSVSAGGTYSLAVGSDGTTYAWGHDGSGQLGDGGANASQATPVVVVVVAVTSVSFGGDAGTDLVRDGVLWRVTTSAHAGGSVDVVLEWTLGGAAQPALTLPGGFTFIAPPPPPTFSIAPGSGPTAGGTEVTVTPPPPPGVTFTSVAAGTHHSLAIGSDGKTYAWGLDTSGQLGDGGVNNTSQSTPVAVVLPPGVTFTSVSVGYFYSLAVGSDGKTYAWGDDALGQLGDGSSTADQSSPVEVQLPDGVTFESVSAGSYHALAVGSDGKTYAWGDDGSGKLGDGAGTTRQPAPVEVVLPAGVTLESVSAGTNHSLAVGSDGMAYAWGQGMSGQLGDGSTVDRSTAVEVELPTGVTVVSVSAGFSHSLAMGSNGKTYAWGSGGLGQLGDGGANTDQSTPVEVVLPPGVSFVGVSAGFYHSLAVGSNGTTYAWGNDLYGQLGNGGATQNQSTPVEVVLPPGVTFEHVSAGASYSLAMGSDGTTYAWGSDGSGQLGDGGGNTSQSTAVSVSLPQVAVTSVSFGGNAGTDLVRDGALWKVTTPIHAAGPADVVLAWTLGGGAQPALTLADGFIFVASVPGVPTDVVGMAGDAAVALSWSAPTSDGGSAVTDYVVEYSDDGGTTWAPFADGTSTATNATVTGLTNDIAYLFQVSATNDVGMGSPSVPSSAVAPFLEPPTGVTVAGGYAQAFVSWTRSADDLLAAFDYTATILQGGDVFSCTTNDTSCVVTGLSPGAIAVEVVASGPTGASTAASGAGSIGSLTDVPATPPGDQGGVSIELRDQAGRVVTKVAPGQQLTLHAAGFAPGSLVDGFVYSTPQHLGTGTTGLAGAATFAVTVPSNLPVGTHTLTAVGLNDDGDTATASLAIEVASAGALASTGWTTASEPLAALLLLAGLLTLWTARRARASRLRRAG
ncbi:MAG: fibronectin type III domain-containing protein [Actinomycetota bacterium]|nr:fibronectin type III domain-containing protein [Actinomycetota bacterium]